MYIGPEKVAAGPEAVGAAGADAAEAVAVGAMTPPVAAFTTDPDGVMLMAGVVGVGEVFMTGLTGAVYCCVVFCAMVDAIVEFGLLNPAGGARKVLLLATGAELVGAGDPSNGMFWELYEVAGAVGVIFGIAILPANAGVEFAVVGTPEVSPPNELFRKFRFGSVGAMFL